MSNPFRYFNSSPEVIRLVVMMYVRYPCRCATSRICWPNEESKAAQDRPVLVEPIWPDVRRRDPQETVAQMRGYPQWRWHVDEMFVKINGKLCYLWRAVDHEGEVLEAVVTAKRNKGAALKLLRRIMKKYGAPRRVVTDGLRAYSAAMNEVGVTPGTKSVAVSTIERRTRISPCDDGSGRCSGFDQLSSC
jgi:putative transposase